MNLSWKSIEKTLLSSKTAGALGGVLGFYVAGGSSLPNITDQIKQLLTKPRVPEFYWIFKNWAESPVFQSGLIGTMVGLVLKMTDLPVIGKLGTPVVAASAGALGGSLLMEMIYGSHNPGLSGGVGAGGSAPVSSPLRMTGVGGPIGAYGNPQAGMR